MASKDGQLPADVHQRVLRETIIPESGLSHHTSQTTPKAILLAGQPGAGKGTLKDISRAELGGNVVVVDPDELRDAYPDVERLYERYPYTWAGHTHEDASHWAKELRAGAVKGRRNLILDTTLGNGDSAITLIKDLQAKGYEVEIRGVVAHRLESELGVDARFSNSLDNYGFGRYVPEDVRKHVYDALPGNLDKVQAETGIQIRLYGRKGAQVYDSHSDTRLPGTALEAEREARLNDPRITQTLRDDWRAQGRWHAELGDTLPHNTKVSPPTAAAVLDERATLKVVEGITPSIQEARGIDHTIRVRPNMVRGAVIGGATATVVEAATEGTRIADLYARDNRTGAEAALLDFGARSVGGWTGAVVGAKVGTLLGIESGPGAIVTGIIGGGLGAWGASEIVEWIEKYQINNQADSTDRIWTFDPAHPEKGWTREETEIVGTVGTLADRPIYGATTLLTADAELSQQLNYQASSRAVGLRLSEPDQPINPFSIAGDASDTPSALPRSWERNPENGEWRREVVHQVLEHGIKNTTVEVADATKAAQLDEAAQGIMAFNAARSSAAFAKQYEEAYTAQGWSRYGAIPDEVIWAREHPDHVLASDGRTYQHQGDGEWLHDGWIYDSLAEGNIRDELNSTYPQIRAIQQMEAPVPSAQERSIEALTANERDAHEQAMQEANRLGVAAPQVQQMAAAAVAEVRGEHAEERLTPQAVIDAHTVERAALAPNTSPLVQEHHAPAPAAPTPSDRVESVQEPARREAPRQEPTAAAATQPARDESSERQAHTEENPPAHPMPAAPLPSPGIPSAERSPAQPEVSALPTSDVGHPAPAQEPVATHAHSPAPSIHTEVTEAAPATARLPEAEATPAPIQLEPDVPATLAAAEPAARPLITDAAPKVSEHEPPYAPPPVEAPAAPPSSATAQQEPEAPPTPLLPTQPEHPDHALYQQVREGVAALDAKHGRTFDQASERMTASLLVLAKDNDLDRVDHVLLSNASADKPAGHTLFVVQGEPSDPAHQRAAMPTELAAQTSVEESMQQFDAVSREAQQRAIANQLEQQLEDQRVQQDIQIRAASMG
ncbi:zeta toxin family protein [Stenotrophomonas maltophilia]|uniref:zeta toxin family protein n=1 Tax=Stenotrophomonas maltophilia TaxID=40324 RepID=UPI000E21DECC|nr:zeta toxin family protein [Stenotrophomonas maltophilia]MCI1125097.1 zeta toxin family protein [Stenotrophomonas maltophilia]REC84264.1 toxin [Stenotrophomonas maltophilia]HEL3791134.1 zeta toxin family protein [Stenotrophomonas maltophilia]